MLVPAPGGRRASVRGLSSALAWLASSVTSLATWIALGGGAVVVVSVLFDVTGLPRLIAAQAGLPYVLLVVVAAGFVALVRRRRAALVVGVATAIAATALIVPVVSADAQPAWAGSAPRLRIYSANVWHGNTDPAAAFAQAERSDADVVVLTEFTPRMRPALESSGLLDRYPTVVQARRDEVTLLLTRLPVVSSQVVIRDGKDLPSATVELGDALVTIAGVHTQSPRALAYVDDWERDVDDVRRLLAGHPNAIAIGDFNSSLWNPPFRELLDGGFTDAHASTGHGLARTWGPRAWPLDHAAVIGIDHSVSRGDLAPLAIDEGWVPGSDHRSITVTYAVR